MEGKRTHDDAGVTESESVPKRICLEEDKDSPDITKQVASHEDDEEFTVESNSDSEQQPSDSEEDFSDDVEEDDDVGSETTIVSGIQGECKKTGEGKYSLHCTPNGREIKIIIGESNIQEAIAASSEKAKKNLIPVFKLTGLEVSKDDDNELIVYAQQLSVLAEDYPKSDDNEEQKEAEGEGEHIDGTLLRIENMDETFITTDFMEKNEA